MRVIVDTQCWLWMSSDPDRLSPRARAIVEDRANELYLSAASAWEIAIKHALGKLRLPEAPLRFVTSRVDTLRMSPLPIDQLHALRVAALPLHHRDPFDRLLVAQAQIEEVPLVTADPVFEQYDVDVIDA